MITAGWSLTLCVCSFQGSVGAHTGNLINALATFDVGHVEKNSHDNDTTKKEIKGVKKEFKEDLKTLDQNPRTEMRGCSRLYPVHA